VIYAGVKVSRMEGKEELTVICVEMVAEGTRGNDSTQRNGVHDKSIKDREQSHLSERSCAILLKKRNGHFNNEWSKYFDVRPHRRHAQIVQLHSPGGANVHLLFSI